MSVRGRIRPGVEEDLAGSALGHVRFAAWRDRHFDDRQRARVLRPGHRADEPGGPGVGRLRQPGERPPEPGLVGPVAAFLGQAGVLSGTVVLNPRRK